MSIRRKGRRKRLRILSFKILDLLPYEKNFKNGRIIKYNN